MSELLNCCGLDDGSRRRWERTFCRAQLIVAIAMGGVSVTAAEIAYRGEVMPTAPPVLSIDARRENVTNAKKTPCLVRLIEHRRSSNDHSQVGGTIWAAIAVRGNSSRVHAKLAYALELQDETGRDLKVPLLGMPSESDWILYPAYTDKTLVRDGLAYELWRAMRHYAPRFRYVELYIRGLGTNTGLTAGWSKGVMQPADRVNQLNELNRLNGLNEGEGETAARHSTSEISQSVFTSAATCGRRRGTIPPHPALSPRVGEGECQTRAHGLPGGETLLHAGRLGLAASRRRRLAAAQEYQEPVPLLTSTRLKARVRSDYGLWSTPVVVP